MGSPRVTQAANVRFAPKSGHSATLRLGWKGSRRDKFHEPGWAALLGKGRYYAYSEVDMPRSIALAALLALAACTTPGAPRMSFNVFFNANSASLTPEANSLIAQAVIAIKQVRPATIAIAAGTGAGSNLRLAQPRYVAVRQALEAKGVPSNLIAQASLPATGAAVNEIDNQRVEIILGK